MLKKPRVAFICTHNACRSQMAEAISRILASETYEAFSAGTEIKKQIDPGAVKTIRELYGVEIAKTQHPKLLKELPPCDIVVTMGCGVQCPSFPCRHREDWGLDDPTGKTGQEYLRTARVIEEKVKDLKRRISERK